jgi:hypothetical protein
MTLPGGAGRQDAITVALDEADGYSAVAYCPYSFNADDRLQVENPLFYAGSNEIFPPTHDSSIPPQPDVHLT